MGGSRPIAILALLVGALFIAVVGASTVSYVVAAIMVGAALALGGSG
jgi:hypothetical protein